MSAFDQSQFAKLATALFPSSTPAPEERQPARDADGRFTGQGA